MGNNYTIGELIKLSADFLENKGCLTPRLDAELLLAHALELDRLTLYLNFEKPLNEREVAKYRELIAKRGQRIPVAYLTGFKEFYSLEFLVNPKVLIPRPETEFVVDKVLEVLAEDDYLYILELGTGSGAISIALAYQNPDFKITATDISQAALSVAKENAERLEVIEQIKFLESDLFKAVEGSYQVICSNPPYIPRAELANLAQEVQKEPNLALDGGLSGLDYYERIIQAAPNHLRKSGYLILEIGWDQSRQVRELGEKQGLKYLETVKDYGDLDRVVVFQCV